MNTLIQRLYLSLICIFRLIKMSQKSALVIGECFSDNVGDQAIAAAMREALEDRGYFVRNVDYTCRLKKSSNVSKAVSNRIWRDFKHKIRLLIGVFWAIKAFPIIRDVAIKKYDLVVVGGGQLIFDNAKFPIALYLWIKLLEKNNSNINIFSCGVNESFCWIEKILIKKALQLSRGIYFRDFRSIENARRNFGVNAKYCPDIAYYLYKKTALRHDVKSGSVMGLSVIDYRVYIRHAGEMSVIPLSELEYINEWTVFVVSHVEAGSNVALLSTTENDYMFAEQVFARVKNICGHRVALYPKPNSWEDFIDQLSSCNSLLSGRMHGLVLAHISRVRPIAYLVNKKVETFSNEYLNKPVEIILLNIELALKEMN